MINSYARHARADLGRLVEGIDAPLRSLWRSGTATVSLPQCVRRQPFCSSPESVR